MKCTRARPIAAGEGATFTLDGEPVTGRPGEPAAAALLAAGVDVFARSVKYHRPRGPFCLDGRCEGCLMRVDGAPNIATCRVPVREGLVLERQNAFPSAQVDFLSAIDWFFPAGMDHHEFMAWLPGPLNRAMQRIARRVGGLGQVPDRPPARVPEVRRSRIDVLVVGAGPAGLSAAISAARAGKDVVLVDEEPEIGGSLGYDPDTGSLLRDLGGQVVRLGVTLRTSTAVAAVYDLGQIVLWDGAGVEIASVSDLILCCGTHAQPLSYEGNDLPGNLSARALLRLIVQHGVCPGRRAVVIGDDPLGALAVRTWLAATDGTVALEVRGEDRPLRARGDSHVTFFAAGSPAGTERRVACDLVIVAATPAPAFELAQQAGCDVAWRPLAGGFVPVADDAGRTRAPRVRVAGHLAGATSQKEAMRSGEKAGELS